MLLNKLQRSPSTKDNAQQTLGCFLRIATTRSVCLSIVASLCFLSALLTVANFGVDTVPTRYTVVPMTVVHTAKLRSQGHAGSKVKYHDLEPVSELKSKLIVNRNMESVLSRLGARINKNATSFRGSSAGEKNAKKLFEAVEKKRLQQSDVGTDFRTRNTTLERDSGDDLAQADQEDNYNPDFAPSSRDEEEENDVDPVRLSFVKSAADYTNNFRSRFRHYYDEPIELLPAQTKGVIIVTNYRSGSTFLGQLFNHHTDAFYTFEPLLPFTQRCPEQLRPMTQVLHQMLKCDFPDIGELYSRVKGPVRHSHLDVECLIDNFCFRRKTDELCGKELCPFGIQHKCAKCGPIHLPRVNNLCRSKKMSVIKVIRLCDIMGLKTIMNDPTMDLKIIHLVRDPRGIQSSRLKIDKTWDVRSSSENTCSRLVYNAKMGFANTTETKWLKDRYYKIRYEDLALEPFKYADEIYKFVGLDFQPQIKRWITQNTQGQKPRTKYKKKGQAFTTNRDSAAAMESWRKHLSFANVSVVQKNCKEAMDMSGYTSVANKDQLLDFNTRLVR
uniref:Sulfotransferase n=1 Tax=Phallusia mammillata TaxID=59560 RepID=A0A6F9D8Q7_9ASCI|nr:carbohydrate sulfotransferase 1 [Phallusia mammillata]